MEEEIKILEEKIKQFKAYKSNVYDVDFGEMMKRLIFDGKEVQTLENLLTRYKLYEQKLMFALTPTTHELALETQRNFKKIIAENINEDTYTIKRELKKYWNNMDTYWKEV